MRSPSTATSARSTGAPVPSMTIPFRISSDHAIDLPLDDPDGLHPVAHLDTIHHVHALRHDAEDRVLTVEVRLRLEADVELAARRVRLLRARHRHGAADVLLLVELGLDGVAGPARTVALGITALDDEARFHAMEGEAVVEALLRELEEVLDGLRRVLGEERDSDLPALVHGDSGGRLRHFFRSFLFVGSPRGVAEQECERHGQNEHSGHGEPPERRRMEPLYEIPRVARPRRGRRGAITR